MHVSLRYREEHFTPAETAAITGLSLTLQRDWRSQGLLRSRTSGRASFLPSELAEMRLMVKLRELGFTLPVAREAADAAAPSVIFAALAEHSAKALTVDAPADQAEAYISFLEQQTDEGYLLTLAGLASVSDLRRHAILENGRWTLLRELEEDSLGDDVEAASVVHLWTMARVIVETAPRPLFTLMVPRDFQAGRPSS